MLAPANNLHILTEGYAILLCSKVYQKEIGANHLAVECDIPALKSFHGLYLKLYCVYRWYTSWLYRLLYDS